MRGVGTRGEGCFSFRVIIITWTGRAGTARHSPAYRARTVRQWVPAFVINGRFCGNARVPCTALGT